MRLAYIGMATLLDPSSGAALEVRTLLELFHQRGLSIGSFSTTRVDRSVSTDTEHHFTAMGFKVRTQSGGVWSIVENDIEHQLYPLSVEARTAALDDALMSAAIAFLEIFCPDVVVTFGDEPFAASLKRELSKRNILVIFYLANPTYHLKKSFDNCDEIWTDTAATHDLYRDRLGLPTRIIGKFIHKPRASDPAARRDMVTFVNPAPEKGVTLFFRIAELAANILPHVNFLVVESRATLHDAERRVGIPFSQMPNVRRIGLQSNLSAVLARTRILLFPSLLPESGGRIALEACALGIPVVASNRGGLPEVLGGAGILIEPPKPLWKNHWLIPPIGEAVPWVESLRRLISEPDVYVAFQKRALNRWDVFSHGSGVEPLISHLQNLIVKRRADH